MPSLGDLGSGSRVRLQSSAALGYSFQDGSAHMVIGRSRFLTGCWLEVSVLTSDFSLGCLSVLIVAAGFCQSE